MNTNCIFGLLHFYDITYIIVGLGPSPNPNSNPTDRKGVVPSRRIDFLLDWKKQQICRFFCDPGLPRLPFFPNIIKTSPKQLILIGSNSNNSSYRHRELRGKIGEKVSPRSSSAM